MPPLVPAALLFAAVAPPAADWPTFLGPNGDGTSPATGLVDAVPDAAAVLLWNTPIGEGYSAPAVVGTPDGPAVLTHRREGRREVLSRRTLADGAVVWESAAPTAFRDPYGYNGGPRASPLVVKDADGSGGGKVYTLGAAGRAACTDLASGRELWARDFRAELDIPRWFFGVGGSPVHYEDGGTSLILFAPGGQPNAGIVACDPDTGETVWEAVGEDTWAGVPDARGRPYDWTGEEQVVSYSTPLLATLRGEPHLLCLVRHGLVSLDPRTGEERFRYWFRSRKYESVNATRPVVVGEDRVLLCAAYGVGSVLLEVNRAGDGVREVWRNRDALGCHWSTPVIVGGHAYGLAGRHESGAELHCVDLADGTLKWSATGREAAGDLTLDRATRGYLRADGSPAAWPDFGRGSLLLAGDTLFILGERGSLYVADPSPEAYREKSRTRVPGLSYPAWPAPVLYDGRLLLCDEDSLTVLDVRGDAGPSS